MTQQQAQQQQTEIYTVYTFEVVLMSEYLQDLAYELDTRHDGVDCYFGQCDSDCPFC